MKTFLMVWMILFLVSEFYNWYGIFITRKMTENDVEDYSNGYHVYNWLYLSWSIRGKDCIKLVLSTPIRVILVPISTIGLFLIWYDTLKYDM